MPTKPHHTANGFRNNYIGSVTKPLGDVVLLDAKRSVGVHWGTFQLADDPLDQPLHDLAGACHARALSEESFLLMPVGGTRRFAKREMKNGRTTS